MLKLRTLQIVESKDELKAIPDGKTLINTINAHSYNVAQQDADYAEALSKGDYLIPDGASIVKACRWRKGQSKPKERIAGWDLFEIEMQKVSNEALIINEKPSAPIQNQQENTERKKKKVMFMGSSEKVLGLIRDRCTKEYPMLDIVTYSPPYKSEFSDEDNCKIIETINNAEPDLLWIGMTAPKQEKWTYTHWNELNINCHTGTIGAVFDFFAGTVKRAPVWWQNHSLEWLYRLLKEPKRMWRRYIIGNVKFLWNIIRIG